MLMNYEYFNQRDVALYSDLPSLKKNQIVYYLIQEKFHYF